MELSPHHRGTAAGARVRTVAIASLTLLSALFLAWSAHKTLGPAVAMSRGEPATFTLRAGPSAEPGRGSAPDHDVTILALIVDGRRARWNEVVREGTWLEGPLDIPPLTHPGDQAPATITFRGTSAFGFALPAAAGRILLEKDGRPLKEVDLAGPRTGLDAQDVAFHFGTSEAPGWTFWPFLVAALGMAAWLRPWVAGRTGNGWILFHAAGLHLLVWATQLVGCNHDAPGYLRGVEEFFERTNPGYFPPGTSIFIGLADLFPWGPLGLRITLLQHAMITLAVLWIYRFLRMSLTEEVAFLTGLVLSSSVLLLFMPQGVQSEPLAFFGMAGALYYAARYRDDGTPAPGILAGVLAGCAALARVVPLVGSCIAFACLHVLPPSWRGLRRLTFLTAVSVAVLAAPLGWFWFQGGERKLTTSDGFHMFNRMVESQKKLAEQGPMTRKLLELLDNHDPRGRGVWETYAILKTKGLDYIEIRELFKSVSLEAVFDAPGEFVRSTLDQAWMQYHEDPADFMAWFGDTPQPVPELECPPPAGFTMAGIEWIHRLMAVHRATWPWFRWLALAGVGLLFFVRQWTNMLAVTGLMSGYILATSAAAYVNARYTVPMVPFMIALAAVPLDVLVRSATGLFGRGRRPPVPS